MKPRSRIADKWRKKQNKTEKKKMQESSTPKKRACLPKSSIPWTVRVFHTEYTLLRYWHFFIVGIFLPVMGSPPNEVLPKLNLPFVKGYSPNKMNRKMPLVHINVILPSSKSVLITTFQRAAWLNGRKAQFPGTPQLLGGGVTHSVFLRALPLRSFKHTLFL